LEIQVTFLTMEIASLVLQVHKGLLVLRVLWVLLVKTDNRVLQDLLVNKDLKEILDHRVLLAKMVKLAHKGHLDLKVNKDLLAKMVWRDHLVPQDLKVNKDLLAKMVWRDHLVPQDLKEILDLRAPLAKMVNKDLLGLKVSKEFRVLLDLRVPKEILAIPVPLELLVLRDLKEILEQWDLKDLLERVPYVLLAIIICSLSIQQIRQSSTRPFGRILLFLIFRFWMVGVLLPEDQLLPVILRVLILFQL
jgi:hypothetical protein